MDENKSQNDGLHLPVVGSLSPMVSYAQNFEDVMLRRALQDIECGYYIDIGAFDPEIDSVTRWFHTQGWTGINVEPNPKFYAALVRGRPRDVNLAVAIAGSAGSVTLHLIDGLSTIYDSVSERHALRGQQAEGALACEAMTLDQLFANHVGARTVDFLKIDVEGAEAETLAACTFDSCRPRILVIEATEPNSPDSAEQSWEPQLLAKGYDFAYFDGLNRFYVRREDAWRKALLDRPPNVFDNYVLPFWHERVDQVAARALADKAAAAENLRVVLDQRELDNRRRIGERDAATEALGAERQKTAELQSALELTQQELGSTSRELDRQLLASAELAIQLRSAEDKLEQLDKLREDFHEACSELERIRATPGVRLNAFLERLTVKRHAQAAR